MKFLLSFLFLMTSFNLAAQANESDLHKKYFSAMKGCFLLYNLKSLKIEKTIGEANCKERLTAFSTFKIPLTVMVFDSGLLKDEKQM